MNLYERLTGRTKEEHVKDDDEGAERVTPEPSNLPWAGSPDYGRAKQILRTAYDSEAATEQPTPTEPGEGASTPEARRSASLADLAPRTRDTSEFRTYLTDPGVQPATPPDPIRDSGVRLMVPKPQAAPKPEPAEACEHCGGRMPTDHELLTEALNALAPAGEEAMHRFYVRLFEVSPNLRELFPEHIEEQEEKLLSAIVALLKLFQAGDEQMEQLDSALARFGRSHTRFEPAATIEEYAAVWTVLGEVVQSMLGDRLTPRHWKALRRAYEYAAGKMLAAQATARFTGTGRRRRTA